MRRGTVPATVVGSFPIITCPIDVRPSEWQYRNQLVAI
jgi:hypothetical protein